MSIARFGGETYTLALAETASEHAAIHQLRQSEYTGAQSYLLAPPGGKRHPASDRYDDRSFVFGCWARSGRTPAATCRFTTGGESPGRYELDELAPDWPRPPVPVSELLETSRVVVARDHRATGLVEVMLLLAGSWLLAETTYRYNFAVCVPPLVRLYARLGMKPTSSTPIALHGRPADKRYIVIYGDMASSQPPVTDRLEHAGWHFSMDRSQREVGT